MVGKGLSVFEQSWWIVEKDLKQSFRRKRNLLWGFLFPLTMLLIFSFREMYITKDINYIIFLVPGIVAMTAMFASIQEVISIVWEKQLGTFDRILAAPVKPISIILGKTLSGAITGFVQAIIILAVASALFGLSFTNLWLALIIAFMFTFAFTGIGILISAYSDEPREAMFLAGLIRFPMLFLCGVFFPIEVMPEVLQIVAYVLPLTYATNALRAVMIKGYGLLDPMVAIDLLALTIYTLVVLSLGAWLLRKILLR